MQKKGTLLNIPDVHADLFLQRVNTKPTNSVEAPEVNPHDSSCPSKNKQHSNELDSKQRKVTTATSPLVEPADVVVRVVCIKEFISGGEEARRNDAPSTAKHVHRDSIDGICVRMIKKASNVRKQSTLLGHISQVEYTYRRFST